MPVAVLKITRLISSLHDRGLSLWYRLSLNRHDSVVARVCHGGWVRVEPLGVLVVNNFQEVNVSSFLLTSADIS